MAFEGSDLLWPFSNLQRVDADDLREAAHEIFFTSCRSSPGFGGRNALAYYSSSFDASNDTTTGGSWAGQGSSSTTSNANSNNGVINSKVKRALGLRMIRRSKSSRRANSIGNEFSCSSPKSPTGSASPGRNAFNTLPPARAKRRMTLAELMRQQLRVTEQGDNRLRKTLVRTLVGQTARKPETIILPLELLRHLKPTEFGEPHEYHMWQRRQFHLLECGLLLHPSISLDKNSSAAVRLRDLARSVDESPLDTTAKNSEAMRSLCNSVLSLSWRSASDSSTTTETCHWADGYPFNIHIYVTLLRSIFDLQDETAILDEVDEMLELMKKTWTTLAISRPIHNLCFTWVLFERFVKAGGGGGPEAELLGATLMTMNEVMGDAKRVAVERDAVYMRILGPTMTAIKRWSEKRLGDYHRYYRRGSIGVMENLLPLVSAVTKILEENVPVMGPLPSPEKGLSVVLMDSTGNKVDKYIRSSLRNAFSQVYKERFEIYLKISNSDLGSWFVFLKLLETQNITSAIFQEEEVNEALLKLAKETEELALREKEIFSPILKKWHPMAAGSAAVSLHSCYGTLLKQYVVGIPTLNAETLKALQSAGKLEKLLVQMVVEDSVDCEDGGKAIVREMIPYEVDGIIIGLLKEWIQERMKKGRECIQRAKETEAWKPMSKNEAYGQSAVELIKMVKEAIGDFFDLPLGITEDILLNFAEGLSHLFHDYISFLASCGNNSNL
ncbi:protein unc-13 homolog [Impatiens glandulifera]|uniref:protein unc-13 homolog n=1 Tax=Impatiens glandulifera TaxID=253017 RepID=UPI001FB0EF45|nr:protein unc-13 homolog [Impatiens glandulifera]